MRKRIIAMGACFLLSVFSVIPVFASSKPRLETPDGLYWSSTSKEDDEDYDEGTVAKWDDMSDVDGFKKYELVLYCEDLNGNTTKMASGITTKKTYYNFKSKMTKAGDYYFKVKAIASGSYTDSYWSSQSEYYYVDSGYDSSDSSSTSDGPSAMIVKEEKWIQDEVGWWYQRQDGSYPVSCWFQDSDGTWYYFDEIGYMKTGWIQDGDKTYYCLSSGAMVTGDTTVDGITYHFDESGALVQEGE